MRWRSLLPHCLVLLVATAATIAMTWPLASRLADGVQDHGDPLLQLWTLKWDLHQLARDPLRLYQANSFHPFPVPLAYSESMLGIVVVFAPIWWLVGDDVVAYNLTVLITFVATVYTTTVLAKELTGRWTAALLAGLAFAFVPYRYGHLSHLNLLSLQWLPLLLLCLWRLLQTGRWRWAVAFALSFLLQALSSFYYAFVAAVACLPMLVVAWPWRSLFASVGRAGRLAVAALAILAVLVPVSLPYFEARDALGFERSERDVAKFAAAPASYLSVAPESWLYRKRLRESYPNPLYPGAMVALLAVVGLATVRRRLALALLAAGLAGAALSFGLQVQFGGVTVPMPYGLAVEHLPWIRGLRDVARFGVVPLLALAVVAAAGLATILRWVGCAGWRRWLGDGLALLLGLVVLAESASGFVKVVPLARDADALAGYAWLADQPPGLLFELPPDGVLGNVARTTRYLYYSTYHWQPMVLGYSGFVPTLHQELIAQFPDDRRAATPSRLTADNVGLLQDLGVRYVVFHRYQYSGGGWRLAQDELKAIPALTLVGQMGEAWVYRLVPSGRLPVRADLLPVNRVRADRFYLAHLSRFNPNATLAAYGFGGRARVDAVWRTADGREQARQRAAVQPGAILEPGQSVVTIEFGRPPAPGRYLVTLESADPRLAPLLPATPIETEVVAPPSADLAAGPPRLIAGAAAPAEAIAGGRVQVRLDWQADGPVPGAEVYCRLVDQDGREWGRCDGASLGGRRPAFNWLHGEIVADRRELAIAQNVPPGRYVLVVGLQEPATGGRISMIGPDGLAATDVTVARVVVRGP